MKAIEKTTDVDILFLPVGGNDALSYEEANNVINQIEAGLIVPTFYETEGVKGIDDLKDEEKFLEEAGVEEPRREDELKVKRSKLDPESPEFVLLNPQ
jgi:L-ascorbate metabolism protein UlaG (beta-lactamase superfamily)